MGEEQAFGFCPSFLRSSFSFLIHQTSPKAMSSNQMNKSVCFSPVKKSGVPSACTPTKSTSSGTRSGRAGASTPIQEPKSATADSIDPLIGKEFMIPWIGNKRYYPRKVLEVTKRHAKYSRLDSIKVGWLGWWKGQYKTMKRKDLQIRRKNASSASSTKDVIIHKQPAAQHGRQLRTFQVSWHARCSESASLDDILSNNVVSEKNHGYVTPPDSPNTKQKRSVPPPPPQRPRLTKRPRFSAESKKKHQSDLVIPKVSRKLGME